MKFIYLLSFAPIAVLTTSCGDAIEISQPSTPIMSTPADIIDAQTEAYLSMDQKTLEKVIEEKWTAKNDENLRAMAMLALEKYESRPAAHKLGLMHMIGRDGDVNLATAVSYFELPLLEDDRWTEFRLGQIYANPAYANTDLDKAKSFYIAASEKGVEAADRALNDM